MKQLKIKKISTTRTFLYLSATIVIGCLVFWQIKISVSDRFVSNENYSDLEIHLANEKRLLHEDEGQRRQKEKGHYSKNNTSSSFSKQTASPCQRLENEWKATISQRAINYDKSGITHELAKQMFTTNLMIDMDFIFGQTICHPQGRFRSSKSSVTSNNVKEDVTAPSEYWSTSNEALVYDWEFRLMYLAIHSLMHEPAYEEYIERKEACGEEGMKEKFPPYDYQCKSSKFLVTAIPSEGLGAIVRSAGVVHMLAGLSSGRIPLFVRNLPSLDDKEKAFLEEPWILATCPRKDTQCVFLPMSPCTLTMDELKGGTLITKGDVNDVKTRGYIRPELDDVRVLIYQSRTTGAHASTFGEGQQKVRQRLYDKAKEMIEKAVVETSHDPTNRIRQDQLAVLNQAAEGLLKRDLQDSYKHYFYGNR